MSDSEADTTEENGREALSRLESVVGRLLEEHGEALARARKAEARAEDLEALLRSFGKGDGESSELQDALVRLEERNRELTGRIDEGRAGVERLLSRLRFLEDQG